MPAELAKREEQKKKAKKNNSKEVIVWGSGKPKREFMYVDDLADAAIKVMNLSKKKFDNATGIHSNFLNVGYGKHYTILEIAKIIKDKSLYLKIEAILAESMSFCFFFVSMLPYFG